MKTELVALKVGLRDGLTLADIRTQRKKLNVVFELNKKQLPSDFSLAGLSLYLDASEHFWGIRIYGGTHYIRKIDASWMEIVVKDDDNVLNAVLLAQARTAGAGLMQVKCDAKLLLEKSLTRCGEEVEKLLAQLE